MATFAGRIATKTLHKQSCNMKSDKYVRDYAGVNSGKFG